MAALYLVREAGEGISDSELEIVSLSAATISMGWPSIFGMQNAAPSRATLAKLDCIRQRIFCDGQHPSGG